MTFFLAFSRSESRYSWVISSSELLSSSEELEYNSESEPSELEEELVLLDEALEGDPLLVFVTLAIAFPLPFAESDMIIESQ